MFRSKFSEDIFKQKYAHEGAETWSELAHTLVEDVCQDKLTKDEKGQLAQYIADLKFVPGGRYLYYAGRPAKYFNNCFSGDHNVLTDEGWANLRENSGKEVRVYSPVDHAYHPATIHYHGEQQTQKITFAPVRGRSKITYTVDATPDHRWILSDGSETTHLRVGDIVPSNPEPMGYADSMGFVHGFLFGDGNANGQLRLCADKDLDYLDVLAEYAHSVTYPEFAGGDPCLYFNQKIAWKKLPPSEANPAYIASFIQGWIAADGHDGWLLNSVNKGAMEWFRKHAAYAGLVITGELRSQKRDVKIGRHEYFNHEIFIQNFAKQNWQGFKVVSIEPLGVQSVFCPEEKVHGQIIIDHNIVTGNCYLLRAEEDTREDWANLSWKAESCLMTGGGIGVDYSRYRASGAGLSRTGGLASGPIPKMQMINEIGRRVMQGGSRRSAIYASLNWQHGDVNEFLSAKNWQDMPVGATGASLWDIKQQDFNFPAPLDMTNISVNYDTAWLMKYWETGDVGDVFRANVQQALTTAEPGFSFNFFDKENETLRNACTEVTSEDDSDVCNLGSINMGRIDDINEFRDIVELATKFLVLGTLRADLPYQKVYDVREKNRRLGLGLMGMHEWLIKRGSTYEVTPELHRWLAIYRRESDRTGDAFADGLGLSRPVAKRAIAPTGSIGILAGTTTGVEPLFAVAYKRRYLKGKKWHYQYVVDGAAQELIELYGADPEGIESAIDLSSNPERRIRFQADVQDYVDQSISSTINLPAWGSKDNNPDTVGAFTDTLARYAHRLRGFTCYPDGARGGQPLTSVPYREAVENLGEVFEEGVMTHDICDISGKGGTCGA
jgi:ribonucleoside-diphosphate reductase alpha chain